MSNPKKPVSAASEAQKHQRALFREANKLLQTRVDPNTGKTIKPTWSEKRQAAKLSKSARSMDKVIKTTVESTDPVLQAETTKRENVKAVGSTAAQISAQWAGAVGAEKTGSAVASTASSKMTQSLLNNNNSESGSNTNTGAESGSPELTIPNGVAGGGDKMSDKSSTQSDNALVNGGRSTGSTRSEA